MKVLSASIFALALTLPSFSAQALLVNCRPSSNCQAAGKPCFKHINKGQTITLRRVVTPQASVIRVRVCASTDDVCQSGSTPQTVSVFGYSGGNVVYTRHLNVTAGYDTGGYTKILKLTRLDVRCSNTTLAHCRIAWQHCLETGSFIAPSN